MIRSDKDKGVFIDIKVVPGARQDQIAGVLGDQLKVRISAPPEGGKANKAICKLLAKALGVRASSVQIVSGLTSAEKVVQVEGVTLDEARDMLGMDSGG